MFKQEKKHIANSMIEFEALAIKIETNNLYIIFLLKKNVWMDIIKIILGYPLMVALETLKEWKVIITSVRQEYKSMKSKQNYKIRMEIIYREKGTPMDIGKTKDNFDKDKKPKCFNCNIYRHMAKDCQKLKI